MGYCLKEYFQTWGGLVSNRSNFSVTRSAKIVGFQVDAFIGKPSIPFAILVGGSVGANSYDIDTIANHKAHLQVFADFWEQTLQASENAADNFVGSVTYVDPFGQNNIDYSQYLVRKIGDPLQSGNPNFDAYMAAMNQVYNFWNMADPAWTNAQLNTALQRLVLELQETCFPRLFIPPGHYLFDSGNAFEVSWGALVVANPNVVAFASIELDSIA